MAESPLRPALEFLNRCADTNPEIDPQTTPWFCATNALIMQASIDEGKSINEFVEEMQRGS